jgi:urea transport system ATP-binding protein
MSAAAAPILELKDVHVSFDGFKALNGLSLSIAPGELRCLIGPNGAGKTTLMDVITGKTRPDRGVALLEGRVDLTRLDEPRIARAGVGRKFQRPSVLESHTVYENLELALKGDRGVLRSLLSPLDAGQRARLEATLRRVDLVREAHRLAGTLSHGQKQWLEIGMLLVQEPKLLLLDEPVAGMTDEETARTAELLKQLAGEHSVVVVEHDMAFVQSIARTVTVLHEGAVLAEGPMDVMQRDPRVVEVYLGR